MRELIEKIADLLNQVGPHLNVGDLTISTPRKMGESQSWQPVGAPVPSISSVHEFPCCRIFGQFTSTNGGGASFCLGDNWRQHASCAPYCPKIDAIALNATIGTDDAAVEGDGEDRLSISRLLGFEGRGITVTIDSEEVWSVRQVRRNVLESARQSAEADKRQGDLEVYRVNPEADLKILLDDLVRFTNNSKIASIGATSWMKFFFDHEVVPRPNQVIGYDFMRLIYVDRASYVVSPNYIFEPLMLGKGWFLLEHTDD